jgi:mono/diheme cytochrome c family protein
MFMPKTVVAVAGLVLSFAWVSVATAADRFDFGKPATKKEIAGWNIDVDPDGTGAPPGSGTVAQGKEIYANKCASCHGKKGQGKPMDRLVGGQGTLASAKPVKTIGSYWPYASTVFDYIRRAMPFNAPGSLSDDEVYSVTAYLLYLNGIVDKDTTLDGTKLAQIKMPNRNGFIRPDPRPDTHNILCMRNCK